MCPECPPPQAEALPVMPAFIGGQGLGCISGGRHDNDSARSRGEGGHCVT